MVCLGLEPRAAGWKAQTNPLSHGGTPCFFVFLLPLSVHPSVHLSFFTMSSNMVYGLAHSCGFIERTPESIPRKIDLRPLGTLGLFVLSYYEFKRLSII